MSPELETIAERIVKLLAKAERTDNVEEAEMFFAKAAALQAKHAIDEIMINAATGKNADDIEKKTYTFKGSYAPAHVLTVHVLAQQLNSRAIQTKLGGSNVLVNVHGFRSDLERLDILFTSLLIQGTRALKTFIKNHEYYGSCTAAEKYQMRKSFLIGFGEGAADQLAEANRAAEKEQETKTPGVGLVLVDRKAQVNQAVEQSYGRLSHSRGTKRNYSGLAGGRAAGRQADMGRKQVGGTKKALGS